MSNGTPWKITERWTTQLGRKVIKYENGYFECEGVIYASMQQLREAIGSTLERGQK